MSPCRLSSPRMTIRCPNHYQGNLFWEFFRILLVSRARNSFAKSLNLAKNQVCICGPYEGPGMLVSAVQIVEHGFLQHSNGSMTASTDTALGHLGEQSFYLTGQSLLIFQCERGASVDRRLPADAHQGAGAYAGFSHRPTGCVGTSPGGGV